jgi:hypothetical protein
MDPDIYHLLLEAVNNKSSVRLFNTYRGVPITADGIFLELHGNDARLQTSALQIICIRTQKVTYLNFGNRILKARLVSSNLNAGLMNLKDFESSKNMVGLRKIIRVEPYTQIKVKFSSPRFGTGESDTPIWYNANLVDLSTHGASIHLKSLVFKQTPVYVDDSAALKMTLTRSDTNIPFIFETKAIIKNIRSFDESYVRIGFQTYPDSNTENTLTHYVAHMQKMIIQELRERLDKERSIIS